MRNRTKIIIIAALYTLGCSVDCPAAEAQQVYTTKQIDEAKRSIERTAENCAMLAYIVPEARQRFLDKRAGLLQALDILNQQKPVVLPLPVTVTKVPAVLPPARPTPEKVADPLAYDESEY